ncbi:type II secretion system protein [Candidatus Azambacteria bacterium]|nr:type II secretion system protein [Candidatus Azambacteria bacterium]
MNRGFGLIEIIIVLAIAVTAIFALSAVSAFSLRAITERGVEARAGEVAAEGLEAARALRDSGWTNIASKTIGAPYYATSTLTDWTLSLTNPGKVDGVFTRQVTFERVFRDASDNIAVSGTEDTRARKVTIQVTWDARGGSKTYTLTSYLMDIPR